MSTLSPVEMGRHDARTNELCLPELYFMDLQRRFEYALGYQTVRSSILAEQVIERMLKSIKVKAAV